MPHLLLCHKVACECGGENHKNRTDERSENCYNERIPEVVYVRHHNIVLNGDLLWEERNNAFLYKLIVRDSVDEDIVEWKNTAECEQNEEQVVQDIEHDISGSQLDLRSMLFEIFFFGSFSQLFFVSHVKPPPYTMLSPRISLDTLLAAKRRITLIMDLTIPITVEIGISPLVIPRL